MSKLPLTDEEKIRAVELAAVHGPAATAEQLGLEHEALKNWCYRTYRKEYAEFREGKVSEWRRGFAARMEDLAEQYGEAERLAVEQALKILKTGDVDAKELAALVKSMGSSRATASQTGARARGEPDHKDVLEINFPQLEQALDAARKQLPTVDSTVVELPAGE